MTMKDIFKKIEVYNEVAELMNTQKAKIAFGEKFSSDRFENYSEFRKFIRKEYIDEVADKILKSEDWKIDGEVEIQWGAGAFSGASTFFAELVSSY